MALFRKHFTKANKERAKAVTVQTAGYHGANAASIPGGPAPDRRAPTITANPETITVSYCWTHGYVLNATHNSRTCNKPKRDHKTAATHADRMGGSTNISFIRPPRNQHNPNGANQTGPNPTA